jgi:hypothetical protein
VVERFFHHRGNHDENSSAPKQLCTKTALHQNSSAPKQLCTKTALYQNSSAPKQLCTKKVQRQKSPASKGASIDLSRIAFSLRQETTFCFLGVPPEWSLFTLSCVRQWRASHSTGASEPQQPSMPCHPRAKRRRSSPNGRQRTREWCLR